MIADRVPGRWPTSLRGRPVLATFQVTLRCNSACGYCDLPLNQGRYELTREEIRRIFEDSSTPARHSVRPRPGRGTAPAPRPRLASWRTSPRWGCLSLVITNGTRLTERPRRAGLLRTPPTGVDQPGHARPRALSTDTRSRSVRRRSCPDSTSWARYPFPKFLTCIVSEANRDEVPDVVRFARSARLSFQSWEPTTGTWDSTAKRILAIDVRAPGSHPLCSNSLLKEGPDPARVLPALRQRTASCLVARRTARALRRRPV
jgi:hypothetical protein